MIRTDELAGAVLSDKQGRFIAIAAGAKLEFYPVKDSDPYFYVGVTVTVRIG